MRTQRPHEWRATEIRDFHGGAVVTVDAKTNRDFYCGQCYEEIGWWMEHNVEGDWTRSGRWETGPCRIVFELYDEAMLFFLKFKR